MTREQQNPLVLPDRRGRNALAIEQWAKNPKDYHALRDREEFPEPRHYWPGTLVQVRGKVYALEGDQWHPLVRETKDSAPIPWAFQGDTTAATVYVDRHYLPLMWEAVITDVRLRIYPALAAGETFLWELFVNDVERLSLLMDATGQTKTKEAGLDIKVEDDDEVHVELTHSAAITDLNVQAFIGVERL
jgi:hypothetical protein